MGESRQELLNWLNELLQLNYTKVEQCGTGAALCQVFDSIYLDVPMQRVKFSVNTEYAYLQNFKTLTTAFAKHGIDRPIPVERLVKCKMQDNLEFLQWMKRHWDQFFPGGEYDAVGRRKGQSSAPVNPPAPRAQASKPRAGGAVGGSAGAARTRTPLGGGASNAALQNEISTLKESVAGLERERDFYFSKLRDIELLLQETLEESGEEPDELAKKIQGILYSTEEGFEIPDEEAGGPQQDDETF